MFFIRNLQLVMFWNVVNFWPHVLFFCVQVAEEQWWSCRRNLKKILVFEKILVDLVISFAIW